MSTTGTTSSGEPGRRWSMTPRQGLKPGDVGRFSRRVHMAKYMLVGLSLVVVATIIIWPQIIKPDQGGLRNFTEGARATKNAVMTKVRYLAGGDRDINITAERIVQDAGLPDLVHLTEIAGDTTTGNGVWVHISAHRGDFDRSRQLLSLKGEVALITGEGEEIHGDRAAIDLNTGEVRGGHPVRGHGPLGRFSADRFVIRDEGATLVLSGKVKLIIEPERRSQ